MSAEIEPTVRQVVRGASLTLAATFFDDGVPADPGVTTVSFVGLEVALVTDAATAGSGVAARTYTLAAPPADLDILTVLWDSANFGVFEQTVEVVGAHLFTLGQARTYDKGALGNVTTYPTAMLEQARVRIGDDFARICGVSFMPRVRRVVLSVQTHRALLLHDLRVLAVQSIETRAAGDDAWTAIDSGDLARVRIMPGGVLALPTALEYGRSNVRVTYEHGWARVPEQIRQAALMVLRWTVVADDVGPRVTSLSGELGTTAYATAGRVSNPWSQFAHYGLPMVDATLGRYSERVPAVG